MPPEGKQPLGFHLLDRDLEGQAFVLLLGLGDLRIDRRATITPRMLAPGVNGPSNFMPNQVPNSVESDSARQTRFRGARRRIFFSMRSVFICNLLVAD